MFDGYRDIFNQRGASYHAAMSRWPEARAEEFAAILQAADLRDGEVVVDIPSGGGYLNAHISQNISLICAETSKAFSDCVADSPRVEKRFCDLQSTGLAPGSVDKVISLAGLHHVSEKRAFFAEVFRILKPGGRFCIADAAADSDTARFLDEFVHEHNSMGHQGDYISSATRESLRGCGFSILEDCSKRYHWNYGSVEEMRTFCGLLFGVDRGTRQQIQAGISKYLGYENETSRTRMNWELTFITCVK
jgi:cyclopropane fatty-acyl-phospholipid synthase-like methyltransferase